MVLSTTSKHCDLFREVPLGLEKWSEERRHPLQILFLLHFSLKSQFKMMEISLPVLGADPNSGSPETIPKFAARLHWKPPEIFC